ncbi:MAG TPA: hypothetical protein VGK23_07315 [Methanomassiliicoccales archaeon]
MAGRGNFFERCGREWGKCAKHQTIYYGDAHHCSRKKGHPGSCRCSHCGEEKERVGLIEEERGK